MLLRNTMIKYMEAQSPEGGDGGGGETPVKSEEQVPVVEETKVELPEGNQDAKTPEEATAKEKDEPTPEAEDKSTLGQVTSLVEAAGLSMKDVAELAKANDGSIDLETMVALKEKHGDAVAGLIAEQIKGIHASRKAEADKRDNAVYDQVKETLKDFTSDPEQTGESMWGELAGWAKENVSNEHRVDINKLLAQGGLAAKLAVQELTTAFKESLGNQEFQEAELLEADTTSKQIGGDISKSDYVRELRALEAKGHKYGSSAEIAKLDNRRAKSIARGL